MPSNERDRRRARDYPVIDRRCGRRPWQRVTADKIRFGDFTRSRALSCYSCTMCSSCRRYRQGRAARRDATVLSMKMARASLRQVKARMRRNVNSDMDSPLSNFLPSGSMSFTLKISSNSTPAMLLTYDCTALWRRGDKISYQVRTNSSDNPRVVSTLKLKNSTRLVY